MIFFQNVATILLFRINNIRNWDNITMYVFKLRRSEFTCFVKLQANNLSHFRRQTPSPAQSIILNRNLKAITFCTPWFKAAPHGSDQISKTSHFTFIKYITSFLLIRSSSFTTPSYLAPFILVSCAFYVWEVFLEQYYFMKNYLQFHCSIT